MSDSKDQETVGRRLVYFAAERTLMAWIRAALGLMALGFVIDRFGLVLRQVLPETGPALHPPAFSFWAGTVMVFLGVVMAVTAAVRYLRFGLAFQRQRDTDPRNGVLIGVFFSLAVALFGLVIAWFLVTATG